MKTEAVSLQIDLGGTTDLIREMWSKGRYSKALEILRSADVPEEVFDDILSGKARMANAGVGEGRLVEDDWRPTGKYPTIAELPKPADEVAVLERKLAEEQEQAVELLLDVDWFRWKQSDEQAVNHLLRALRRYPTRLWYRRWVETYGVKPMIPQTREDSVFSSSYGDRRTDFDKALDEIADREEPPSHVPDVEMKSPSGWLLPDGKYYACGYMEHIGLAIELAQLDGDEPLDQGWVMVRPGWLHSHKPPTQRQIDALFDWAQRHNKSHAYDAFMHEWNWR